MIHGNISVSINTQVTPAALLFNDGGKKKAGRGGGTTQPVLRATVRTKKNTKKTVIMMLVSHIYSWFSLFISVPKREMNSCVEL